MHACMNACMHLLSTSSSKSAPGPSVFLTFFFGDQLLGDDDDDEDGGDDDDDDAGVDLNIPSINYFW